MKVVGPAKSTISMITMAMTMLMFERILMPLSTPVQADSRKATVIAMRMATATPSELGSVPKTSASPERTNRVPMPSEPAKPKTTAITAITSATTEIALVAR